jgi:hypothetical protein
MTHNPNNRIGTLVQAVRLPWSQKWRRHFRALDRSKQRHNTPYAPSGSFVFGFAFLGAIMATVNVLL